jgi:hypothetical protein
MPDRPRIAAVGEVHALDEGVAHRDQVIAGRRPEQRAVVADPEPHIVAVRAAGAEEAVDELELAERHIRWLSARADAIRAPRDRARR